eukprot:Awhi_evm1s625
MESSHEEGKESNTPTENESSSTASSNINRHRSQTRSHTISLKIDHPDVARRISLNNKTSASPPMSVSARVKMFEKADNEKQSAVLTKSKSKSNVHNFRSPSSGNLHANLIAPHTCATPPNVQYTPPEMIDPDLLQRLIQKKIEEENKNLEEKVLMLMKNERQKMEEKANEKDDIIRSLLAANENLKGRCDTLEEKIIELTPHPSPSLTGRAFPLPAPVSTDSGIGNATAMHFQDNLSEAEEILKLEKMLREQQMLQQKNLEEQQQLQQQPPPTQQSQQQKPNKKEDGTNLGIEEIEQNVTTLQRVLANESDDIRRILYTLDERLLRYENGGKSESSTTEGLSKYEIEQKEARDQLDNVLLYLQENDKLQQKQKQEHDVVLDKVQSLQNVIERLQDKLILSEQSQMQQQQLSTINQTAPAHQHNHSNQHMLLHKKERYSHQPSTSAEKNLLSPSNLKLKSASSDTAAIPGLNNNNNNSNNINHNNNNSNNNNTGSRPGSPEIHSKRRHRRGLSNILAMSLHSSDSHNIRQGNFGNSVIITNTSSKQQLQNQQILQQQNYQNQLIQQQHQLQAQQVQAQLNHQSQDSLLWNYQKGVDEELIASLPEIEVKRQQCIFRFYISEMNFLEEIEHVKASFYDPLCSLGIMSTAHRDGLFGDFDIFLTKNKEFFVKLKEIQEKEWPLISDISPLLLDFFSTLHETYHVCCSKLKSVAQKLPNLITSKTSAARLVNEICRKEQMTELELAKSLIRPLQRISQYVALTNVLKYSTPKDHPSYDNVQKAYLLVEKQYSFIEMKGRGSHREQKSLTARDNAKPYTVMVAPLRLYTATLVNPHENDTVLNSPVINGMALLENISNPRRNSLNTSNISKVTSIPHEDDLKIASSAPNSPSVKGAATNQSRMTYSPKMSAMNSPKNSPKLSPKVNGSMASPTPNLNNLVVEFRPTFSLTYRVYISRNLRQTMIINEGNTTPSGDSGPGNTDEGHNATPTSKFYSNINVSPEQDHGNMVWGSSFIDTLMAESYNYENRVTAGPPTWQETIPNVDLESLNLTEEEKLYEVDRQEIIYSAITMVSKFVRSIDTLLRSFYRPFTQIVDARHRSEYGEIYQKTMELSRHNYALLQNLRVQQAQSNRILDVIPAFLSFVETTETIYLLYSQKVNATLQDLASLRISNPEFASLVSDLPHLFGEDSLLTKPIYHPKKLLVLFQKYVAVLPENHPTKEGAQTLTEILEKLSTEVDSVIQKLRLEERFYDVQSRIEMEDFRNPSLHKLGREFLREGFAAFQTINLNQRHFDFSFSDDIYAFLFNDIMLLTKQKKNVGHHHLLSTAITFKAFSILKLDGATKVIDNDETVCFVFTDELTDDIYILRLPRTKEEENIKWGIINSLWTSVLEPVVRS